MAAVNKGSGPSEEDSSDLRHGLGRVFKVVVFDLLEVEALEVVHGSFRVAL